MPASLYVKQLDFARNEQILFSDLNFALQAGEALQIAGPNGAGKTTLLRMLCGLLSPTQGEILWREQSIYNQREEYVSELIYLGHQPALKMGLTVGENLALALAMNNSQQKNIPYHHALEQVGLAEYQNNLGHTLSAGQQRRLMLAKLLLLTATLWILDEPFTALDASGVALVEKLLVAHITQGGIAIVTSHQTLDLKIIKHKTLLLENI